MNKIEEDVFLDMLINDGFRKLVERFDLDIDFSRQTEKSESIMNLTKHIKPWPSTSE